MLFNLSFNPTSTLWSEDCWRASNRLKATQLRGDFGSGVVGLSRVLR